MIKKVSAGAGVFAAVFIISVWLMFPYRNVVTKAVTAAAKDSGLNISYSEVHSGPFSTVFENLDINGVPLDSLKASYSPLSVFTRSAGIKTEGLIKADADVSPSSTEYKAEISESVINSIAGGKAVLSAPLILEGTGAPDEHTAELTLAIAKLELDSPIGKLPFENLEADISVKGAEIKINKLTSKDDMNLNLRGIIKIDFKRAERSMVSISGTADVFGQQKKLTLSGRFDKIQPSIK